MKLIYKLFAFSLFVATVVSCNKDELTPSYSNLNKGETILGVTIDQVASKMGYNDNEDGGWDLKWKSTDSISIYTAEGVKYADYGIVSIDSVTSSACFKGAALAVGEEYVAVFPKSDLASLTERNAEPIPYFEQEGNGDNRFLKHNCRMSTDFAYDSTATIAFAQDFAIVDVRHTSIHTPIAVELTVGDGDDAVNYRAAVSESKNEKVVDNIHFLIRPVAANTPMKIVVRANDGNGFQIAKQSLDFEAGKCYTTNVGDYFTLENVVDQNDDIAVLRQKCFADLLSQSELALFQVEVANELEAKGVTNLSSSLKTSSTPNFSNAISRWDSMQDDGSWADIDYTSTRASSWPVNNHLIYLNAMAVMYQHPQSPYYKNEELKDAFNLGLKYWTTNDFKGSTNWFPRVIGTPLEMVKVLLLMKDEIPVSVFNAGINITNRAAWVTGNFPMTGANKISIANIFLYRGAIIDNEAQIKEAVDSLNSEMNVVNFGLEGMQKDFTYHQHGPLLQNGAYGIAQTEVMTVWFNNLYGTKYAFSEEKVSIIRNFLLGSVNASTYNGEYDLSSLGRGLAENRQASRTKGFSLRMVEMMRVDPTYKDEYMKYIVRNFSKPYDNDLVGNFYYDCSKYMLHRTKDYMMTIRMVSDKVYGGETVNDENLRGYFLGDGASLCYHRTGSYENIYPIWNPFRIAGTTVVADESLKPQWFNNIKYTQAADFVGGVGGGCDYGVAVMEYNRNFVTANKTYFCFGPQVFCVGNSVKSSKGDCQTTLDQTNFRGELQYLSGSAAVTGSAPCDVKTDRIICDGVGYQTLDGQPINMTVKEETGNWKTNVSKVCADKTITGNVFTATIPHTLASSAAVASYAYMIEPAADAATFFADDKELDVKVVSNTSTVTAVESESQQVGMYVFWTAGSYHSELYGDITAEQPIILRVMGDGENFTTTCSNPLGTGENYSISGTAPAEFFNITKAALVQPVPMSGACKTATVRFSEEVAKVNGDLMDMFDLDVKSADNVAQNVKIATAALSKDGMSVDLTFDNPIYGDDITTFAVLDSTLVTDIYDRALVDSKSVTTLATYDTYSLTDPVMFGFEQSISTDKNFCPGGWYGNPSYVSGNGMIYGMKVPTDLPNMTGVGEQTLIVDVNETLTADQKFGMSLSSIVGDAGNYLISFKLYQPEGTEFTLDKGFSFVLGGTGVWMRPFYSHANLTSSPKDQWVTHYMPISLPAGITTGNLTICFSAGLNGPVYIDDISILYDTRRVTTATPMPKPSVVE